MSHLIAHQPQQLWIDGRAVEATNADDAAHQTFLGRMVQSP
jgi:hypothetical protein